MPRAPRARTALTSAGISMFAARSIAVPSSVSAGSSRSVSSRFWITARLRARRVYSSSRAAVG